VAQSGLGWVLLHLSVRRLDQFVNRAQGAPDMIRKITNSNAGVRVAPGSQLAPAPFLPSG
jgi:hypothetical protein